jgi:hypothetical protein
MRQPLSRFFNDFNELTIFIPAPSRAAEDRERSSKCQSGGPAETARPLVAGRFSPGLKPMPGRSELQHGHCHQRAFATAGAAAETLRLIPELDVETFDSTCCGMAGAFGYEAEHYDMSLRIGELGMLPRLRAAPPDTLIAACGTSCRHQIADALGRDARHIVRLLDDATTRLDNYCGNT